MELKLIEIYKIAEQYFKVFVEEIVGLKNEPFHDELDDNISNPLFKRIIITYPRGHGKSTHLSIAYPLWRIAKNHNLRILLISSTGMISKSFMSEVISHIDRNEAYQAFARTIDPQGIGVVPRMKNYAKQKENWAGDSIVIDRDVLNLKDPTINAVGLFGSILSKRADVIICDDIVNQENSNTEDQRQKIYDWVRNTVLPVLVPGGEFIYLGNTWHQDDLVSRLMKDPMFEFKKRMPAIEHESNHPELWEKWAQIILDESKEVKDRFIEANKFHADNQVTMDEGVKVLWPSRYPYKDLYLLRLSDSYSFSRMYQCDPSNRPNQKIKDEWIESALAKGKDLKLQDEERKEFMKEITACGLDLAISMEFSADDTSFLVLDKVMYGNELYKTGDFILRQVHVGKMSPNNIRIMIRDFDTKYQPMGIRVETVGYQKSMAIDLEDMGVKSITSYHTGSEKNDPQVGVNSLAILMELGKLILPFSEKDQRTRQIVSRLCNEMRAFPDGHTGDILMSLWFAYSEIRELTGNKLVVPTPEVMIKDPELTASSTPEERAPHELEADRELIRMQEYEKAEFRRLMQPRLRR